MSEDHALPRSSDRMAPRTDNHTAALIALALFLSHVVNRQFAAKMLARHRIPITTARRILATPHRRYGGGQASHGAHPE